MANDRAPPTLTLRVLSLVTDVRRGEVGTALLFTLNIFVLLTGYYILKPVREVLIYRQPGGAEIKAYLSAVVAVVLIGAVPAYSMLANRVARHRLVITVTLIFAANLLLFYLASKIESAASVLGAVFYVWMGMFSMMAVAQVWAFANDVYTEEQGGRLFALLGLGASLGGVAGPLISTALQRTVGVYERILLAAGLLVMAAYLAWVIHHRESRAAPHAAHEHAAPARDRRGAFRLVLTHRYLFLIGVYSLLFTLVNSNGEYLFGKLASHAAEDLASERGLGAEQSKKMVGDFVGAQFNQLFLWVNTLALVIQALLVSRVVKYWGLSKAFFVFPLICLASAGAVAIAPLLGVIKLGKTAENATDYSLNNTLRNMLWLPTTRAMKYKAKQATDTFFVRLGDVSSAGLVFVGTGLLALPVRAFALANVALVLAWTGVAWMIVRENRALRRGDAAPEPASGGTGAVGIGSAEGAGSSGSP